MLGDRAGPLREPTPASAFSRSILPIRARSISPSVRPWATSSVASHACASPFLRRALPAASTQPQTAATAVIVPVMMKSPPICSTETGVVSVAVEAVAGHESPQPKLCRCSSFQTVVVSSLMMAWLKLAATARLSKVVTNEYLRGARAIVCTIAVVSQWFRSHSFRDPMSSIQTLACPSCRAAWHHCLCAWYSMPAEGLTMSLTYGCTIACSGSSGRTQAVASLSVARSMGP
mmetsp:Transcript_59307/g.158566  ORF Transcript_59307/g.158566 Transcript_59307/m.158566 type:complete len:232 (+) Transcript_59307:290-985(+)